MDGVIFVEENKEAVGGFCGKTVSEGRITVAVEEIMPNRAQPRRVFDQNSLIELSESIRENGLLQPIVVRECEDVVGSVFKYELIAGERRLRACKMAGLTEILCILLDVGVEKSAELAIIENLHRKDLGIFETAEAIASLIEVYGLTQEEVARKLSITQSAVANKLRLLKLSETERELIISNDLTERHARCLIRIGDECARKDVLERIIEKKMNVSAAEEYVAGVLDGAEGLSGVVLRDGRGINCVNVIQKVINKLRKSGCEAKSTCTETDDFYIYTITVGKN